MKTIKFAKNSPTHPNCGRGFVQIDGSPIHGHMHVVNDTEDRTIFSEAALRWFVADGTKLQTELIPDPADPKKKIPVKFAVLDLSVKSDGGAKDSIPLPDVKVYFSTRLLAAHWGRVPTKNQAVISQHDLKTRGDLRERATEFVFRA